MSDDYRTSHTPLWRRGALILGVITLAAAALALIGWALDVPALYRVFATWPPMVPATALSFVLVGGRWRCWRWPGAPAHVLRWASAAARLSTAAQPR